MEEWKQIKDYPNYSVSCFGNVRNDKTGKLLSNNRLRGKGYNSVALYNGKGERKDKSTHKLVGEAFIENPNNYDQIDHIDNDKLNNNISNLRWVNNSLNQRNVEKYKRKCSSTYKGVCFCKRANKFITEIMINRKKVYLGSFETEKEAGLAYNNYITENNLSHFILNEI
jgi:hypothetical protein